MRPTGRLRLAASGALALSAAACVSVPPGTTLGSPAPAEQPIPRRAWVHRVVIHDPLETTKAPIEDSLTLSLQRYLDEGRFFEAVNIAPGRMRPDDLTLRVELSRYRLKRRPHPAYFPGALLTLTLYIWFGGPIFNDRADLEGSLVVEDAAGQTLARSQTSLSDEHSVNLWSSEYALPSGAKERTRFVRDLLDRALAELRARKEDTTP